MSEYDLACDVCGGALQPNEGVVTWREDAPVRREGAFALTHVACAPAETNARLEARTLTWPNGYLAFFGERFSRSAGGWNVDTEGLRELLDAFAPFVMRPDNAAEMDALRAASFGARPGVKFGAESKDEGGK